MMLSQEAGKEETYPKFSMTVVNYLCFYKFRVHLRVVGSLVKFVITIQCTSSNLMLLSKKKKGCTVLG